MKDSVASTMSPEDKAAFEAWFESNEFNSYTDTLSTWQAALAYAEAKGQAGMDRHMDVREREK